MKNSKMEARAKTYLQAVYRYDVASADAVLSENALIVMHAAELSPEAGSRRTLTKQQFLEEMKLFKDNFAHDHSHDNVDVVLTNTTFQKNILLTGVSVSFDRCPASDTTPWDTGQMQEDTENFVYGNLLELQFDENGLITQVTQGLFPEMENKNRFHFIL